jgi:hypothetical protein
VSKVLQVEYLNYPYVKAFGFFFKKKPTHLPEQLVVALYLVHHCPMPAGIEEELVEWQLMRGKGG